MCPSRSQRHPAIRAPMRGALVCSHYVAATFIGTFFPESPLLLKVIMHCIVQGIHLPPSYRLAARCSCAPPAWLTRAQTRNGCTPRRRVQVPTAPHAQPGTTCWYHTFPRWFRSSVCLRVCGVTRALSCADGAALNH